MRRLVATAFAAVALALFAAAPASAAFGLNELDVIFTNQDGSTATQAGSHPYAMSTTLGLNTHVVPEGATDPNTELLVDGEIPDGEVKDMRIDQIEGLVGSQSAVPKCSSVDFNTRVNLRASCPDSTAVGVAAVKAEFNTFPVGVEEYVHVPVYNLAPSPGEAAKLGFVALDVPIVIDVGVNDKPPYNLVARLDDVPQGVIFYSSTLTIWGNPANSSHDSLRGSCVGEPLQFSQEPISLGSCPVNVPEAPFLTLPRACNGPLATIFTADSWANPGAFTEPQSILTHNESEPPIPTGMTGCSLLNFDPTIAAQPTTAQGESPSGLSVDLDVKDVGLTSSGGRAKADIKKVQLTLPEGVTVNPSAAEGLGVCTLAQYNAASAEDQGCPESSKLGTVLVKSPLIEEPVEGSIFLAAQEDNPFGSLLAFYMLLENPRFGIFIKQAGKVEPDPQTGQLVSTVDDIPQLPFSHFTLRFREGPRAPLATPGLCGTYTTKAVLTPWSGGESVLSDSTFTVSSGPGGGPCPTSGTAPFRPGFEAGTVSNAAGSYSPFYMHLTRADGEQSLTRFDAVLPAGVVPKLAGIPSCTDAQIAAAKAKTGRQELAFPSCPAASQIGRVLAGAGVGSALTYVPGKIYLAGPFGGDPLSVVVIVPAVAGPFDVGTVVTREAITIDPETYVGEIDGAASDPIPHILKGIPLKLRDLRVYVDRSEFMRNATSCNEGSTLATVFGSGANVFAPSDDVPATVAARYQAASCASLAFKPSLRIQLKGETKRGGFPKLHSVVTYPEGSGYANIGSAVVTLPHSAFISPLKIANPCIRPLFAEGKCPPASRLGYAKAWTPLLDEPLQGPVYFRSNGGVRDIPDIVADLNGQFHVVLVGAVDSVGPSNKARLRTTFASVPDAPVTRFELDLKGGKEGVIENSQNLCAGKRYVKVKLRGQNGKLHEFQTKQQVKCGGKKGGKRRARHSRRR